ncbi:hypothetical protein SCBWM1_gp153 [Synechococcus phage S-CBWM1]|uniref:Uncharacterized protein n=1 Tax=Synechococcus phage S-CBWM1 TaxID=2053653 RepID=A0A3G1L3T5_9CAUD|nr:hypothetical protein HOU61_gp044 [Synechococcus phage S-CBWM1]ATW62837.1 hypothetical protein SCBWM1_gp153 [Synechococcus phage S-CBWM1]
MAKLPKDHGIDAHKDAMGRCMHRFTHHDPRPLHSGRGKKGKGGKVVTDRQQAIAVCLSIQGKGGDGYSESALAEVSELLSEHGEPYIPRGDKKSCPRGTTGKGKWCKVRFPDREFYIQVGDGESCPSGTRGSGGDWCVGKYSEARYENYAEGGTCPPSAPKKKRSPAQQAADSQRSQQQRGERPNIPQRKQEQGLRKAQRQRDRCGN